jgi:hypothetical protein
MRGRRGGGVRVARRPRREQAMVSTILVAVLVVLLLGAVPAWSYSRDWGYYPGGLLGVVLLVMIILILSGTM